MHFAVDYFQLRIDIHTFDSLFSIYNSSATVYCSLIDDFLVRSGWISALTGLNRSIPVGIIMILIAALFTFLAAMSLIMFKKVDTQQT